MLRAPRPRKPNRRAYVRNRWKALAQSFTFARQLQLNGGETNFERRLTAPFSSRLSARVHTSRINRSTGEQ
jgi:hypothetical protein